MCSYPQLSIPSADCCFLYCILYDDSTFIRNLVGHASDTPLPNLPNNCKHADLGGHALAMGSFGAMGYAYYHADQHVLQLLEVRVDNAQSDHPPVRLAGVAVKMQ